MPRGDDSATHPALLPLQEAVDDILLALKLDPRMVVPEIRSLKPEAQALITQGLWSRCRALLSQPLVTGAALSDEDAQGLLAVGEALIKIDAGQPRGHILLADAFTAMGMPSPGLGNVGVCPGPSPLILFCKMEETLDSVPPGVLSTPNPGPCDLVPMRGLGCKCLELSFTCMVLPAERRNKGAIWGFIKGPRRLGLLINSCIFSTDVYTECLWNTRPYCRWACVKPPGAKILRIFQSSCETGELWAACISLTCHCHLQACGVPPARPTLPCSIPAGAQESPLW